MSTEYIIDIRDVPKGWLGLLIFGLAYLGILLKPTLPRGWSVPFEHELVFPVLKLPPATASTSALGHILSAM